MSGMENEKCVPVLDPLDRVSGIIVGLIMAMRFTRSLSAATVWREEIRTKMSAVTGQMSAAPVLAAPSP